MKAINNKRAKFLSQSIITASKDDICTVLQKILAAEPTYSDHRTCDSCKIFLSEKVPFITINNEIFANDFSNLEDAILEVLPTTKPCTRCQNPIIIKRDFAPHMFIKVISNISNILFYQIVVYKYIDCVCYMLYILSNSI